MSNYSIKPDGFQEAIAMLNIMHEEATGERGHYRSTYLNSGLILLDWSTESVIYTEAASFDEDELTREAVELMQGYQIIIDASEN